jgi:hypothetical protein
MDEITNLSIGIERVASGHIHLLLNKAYEIRVMGLRD